MKAPLIHVAGLIFNEPLAIMPSKLEAILHAIGPRLVVDDVSALDELLRLHAIHNRPVLTADAVLIDAQAPKNGNGEEKPYRLTPEGVAVIPVRGTLMKRFSFLSSASGFSSYAGLAQAATQAQGDPQVKALLFDIDSPGGTTHGCFELSDTIYQMRGGDKPMWACANDLAASAAYALASAVDRVWLTRTAGVGSVGVFALHADQSGLDGAAGVKYTYVFAGERKVDGNPHEPLSKSAKADIQAEVDREHDIFLMTVARNRGFAGASIGKIAATQAGVYFAQNAVPLLADEVGTFDQALEALTAKISGSRLIPSGKVALQTDSADNAQATGTEQGVAMSKPSTEDLKRAKTEAEDAETLDAAAAKPNPDNDEEDDGDGDDEKPKEDAKKSKKAKSADDEGKCSNVTEIPTTANAPAKRIADLCIIGGVPELAAEYITKGYSVDKVIEKLSARRAKASAEGGMNSFVAGDGGAPGGEHQSVDAAIKQSRIMAAASNGTLKPSQAMEQLLRSNPEIYGGYLEEKNRVMSQISYSGGGRVLNEYVLNTQRRYMAQLGLGTVIDDVPGRRSM